MSLIRTVTELEPSAAEPPPARPLRWHLPAFLTPRVQDLSVACLFLLGGMWIMIWGWRNTHLTPGHLVSDHYWFQWLLSHSARSVTHLENPFFSDQMNFPDGINLMANTSILGVGVPLTPVTLLFGPSVSYLTAMTLGVALTAFSAYFVLSRYVVKSRLAAVAGGALFGFAPGFVHHASGQPNFVMHLLLPLIVLFAAKLIVETRPVRNGIILGLLVTYQVFINEEALLITALGCAGFAVVLAVLRPRYARDRLTPLAKGLGIALAVALPLLAYPLWFQFAGPQSYESFAYFHNWGEDIAAYATFSRDTLSGNEWVESRIGATEQNTWYGWPLLALIGVSVVLLWRSSLLARVATLTGAMFALLALGPTIRFQTVETSIPAPWKLFGKLPVLEMVLPSRLTFVVTGVVAVLVALFADRVVDLAREHADSRLKLIGAAAVLAALLPIAPWPLKAHPNAPVPDFVSSGHWREYVDDQHSVVPLPLPSATFGVDALRWNATTINAFQMPMGYFIGPMQDGMGGYGAPATPFTDYMVMVSATGSTPPSMTDQVRTSAMADVRRWRAAVAFVDVDHGRSETIKASMEQLFGPAQRVDDVYLWDLRSFSSP